MKYTRHTRHILLSGLAVLGVVGIYGPLSGCSSAATDEDTTSETSDATKSSWIQICAEDYYKSKGLTHPKWLLAPSATGRVSFQHYAGTFPALWTAVLQFPGEDGQRVFSIDDDEVGIKNCKNGIFEDNTGIFAKKPWPKNPPGGLKIQKEKCLDMGCFWQSEHTSHPHKPCPGPHQHLYCYNWSEEQEACFLQKTKTARCTEVPAEGCPLRTHQCDTVCCPQNMSCTACITTPGE